MNLYIQKFRVLAPSESTFRKKWKNAGFNLQDAGGFRLKKVCSKYNLPL